MSGAFFRTFPRVTLYPLRDAETDRVLAKKLPSRVVNDLVANDKGARVGRLSLFTYQPADGDVEAARYVSTGKMRHLDTWGRHIHGVHGAVYRRSQCSAGCRSYEVLGSRVYCCCMCPAVQGGRGLRSPIDLTVLTSRRGGEELLGNEKSSSRAMLL